MKGGKREGSGRKAGSGQAAHYRAMLEPYAEDLIQQVVDLAKGGDMAALKLCLDRLCAPLRATDRLITIEGMESCKELSDKGDLILVRVATGDITPTEASSLMGAISSQAKIIEADELERRVSELENRNESK
jgi:polyhydroxyalkanoate synthesis regulator phasin